jgi:hypothetical protein
MLRATLETLRLLERGLTGYALTDNGPCHLFLFDGSSVKVSVVGTDVAPKFECFSLALDVAKAPAESVTAFATPKDGTAISILFREEYIETFTGDSSHLVGQHPMTQTAAKPGHVPKDALASCLVAYGLLIEGAKSRLAIVAGWLPFKIEATTDEARIAAHLAESEAVSIARYAELYGFS